ncbi:polyamine ABC transporter substrate-binding protein [Neptuniibacter halophilus]|uniref:polyamine ABC transporter substrate-binding protein n=1 Tax=Neptuniibacter halophilus TaxID=651666 RepID=UPI00257436C6|nr:polyamine ABC transporter substrate-binding protein [Neptuniibacter halophilus]
MKKACHQLLLGCTLLTPLAHATENQTLNIYNWSDYITDEAIEHFEARTGIKVNYDVYDSQEMAETKVLLGDSGYDLVVASGAFLQRQIQAGAFQPLDKSRLKNYANLDPKVLEIVASYDPENQHAIPYMWGTTGIGYNVAQANRILGDTTPDSWKTLFEPEVISQFAECGVAIVDAPTEVSAALLKYLGKDPNSESREDLKQVEEKLRAIRPYVQYFDSSRYINDLANGEICLALGWSGDVFTASLRAAEADNGIQVDYVIPKEGAQGWADTFNLVADSGNAEAAYAFLDYLMEPEVIAGISDYIWYANANQAATPLVNPEITGHPGIYPTAETHKNLFGDRDRSAKYKRMLTRMWTRIKTDK